MALICAVVANCNRDPKKRSKPYAISDFTPYKKQEQNIEVGIEALNVFVRK